MFLPFLLLAAVAGLLVYETAKNAAPPGPGPGRCAPATSLVTGHLYKFGYALPAGTDLSPAAVAQVAQAIIGSGNFSGSTQAWARGDVSAVAFGWPPDAPDSSVLVYGTYTGPGEPVSSLFLGAVDCGLASGATPVMTSGAAGLPVLTSQTGFWGGQQAGQLHAGQLQAGQLQAADQASSDCNCITPDQVMQICVLILTQAMEAGALPNASTSPSSSASSPSSPSLSPTQLAPAPAALAGPAPAPVAAAGRTARPAGRGPSLRKGQAYFVSYPAGAALSTILWSPSTVADAAASPTSMIADPTQNVKLPQPSVPASAPAAWLSHFGPGRAIAVLTWIGPDGGSDPGVAVWAPYSAGQAGQAQAAFTASRAAA
jgi:hypothetical protein